MADAPTNICAGCGTPRHKTIAGIAAGAWIACCPDCSTLTVDDRNAIRSALTAVCPYQVTLATTAGPMALNLMARSQAHAIASALELADPGHSPKATGCRRLEEW